jgi:hypothetical protein
MVRALASFAAAGRTHVAAHRRGTVAFLDGVKPAWHRLERRQEMAMRG